MSQSESVLQHLQSGKSLTPLDAYLLYGTLALHSRVSELRDRGHDINCEMVTVSTGKRVGSYTLNEKIAYG